MSLGAEVVEVVVAAAVEEGQEPLECLEVHHLLHSTIKLTVNSGLQEEA